MTAYSNFAKTVDYDKTCISCGFKEGSGKQHMMCTRPVDIITGESKPNRCLVERSGTGSCGPKGRNYSAGANIWEEAKTKEKKVKENA